MALACRSTPLLWQQHLPPGAHLLPARVGAPPRAGSETFGVNSRRSSTRLAASTFCPGGNVTGVLIVFFGSVGRYFKIKNRLSRLAQLPSGSSCG